MVYGGFSAGGLAALVAGAARPAPWASWRSTWWIRPGDRGRDGARSGPAADRSGRCPSACNARNNGRAVFAVSPQARLTAIPGASHCDFESPTDWLCEAVCSGVDAGSPARRRVIIDAAVAAVSDLLGLNEVPTAGPH